MDLLGYLLAGAADSYPPDHDFWYRPTGSLSDSGLRVDEDTAQRVSAWFRGKDLLATSLAMLPFPIYRQLPEDRGRDRAKDHPLYRVLHNRPNRWQNSFEWRKLMMANLIDHGNGYNFILPSPDYFVGELRPILPPTRVRPKQQPDGRIVYFVQNVEGGRDSFSEAEIFHLRGLTKDGVEGIGILSYARDNLGIAQSTESYAARVFRQGALHGGTVTFQGPIHPDSKELMRDTFRERMVGRGNWHNPVLLSHGAKWERNTMTAEEAQMLTSREFSVLDIARWLGLPPHMLGDLKGSTGKSNLEQQGQEFVTFSLGGWLSLFEFAANGQLILDPDEFHAEFVREALVRGSLAVRWAAHVKAVTTGTFTRNEVREIEGKNKLDGLDEPLEPRNITGGAQQVQDTPDDPDDGRGRTPDEDREGAQAKIEDFATAAAGRLLRREIRAVQKAAVKHATDADAFANWVAGFYKKHALLVAEALCLTKEMAEQYCTRQALQLLGEPGLQALETWALRDYAAGVGALALEEEL